jgi:hypothetical protein
MIQLPKETKTYKEPGRNEKCPCESGKKYKDCCLAKAKKEQENIRMAIEQMRQRVYADARIAVDKCKRDGTPDNLTENEKAALAILAKCEIVPNKSRMQEGIVTFDLKHRIEIIVKDGQIGVREIKTVTPAVEPPKEKG